jgi:hypothetical protein
MNAFVEADYRPGEELTLYGSFMLTVDWNYIFDENDEEWIAKRFDLSKGRLFVDDAYWQIVKELHVTWTPGDFLFRLGKQAVSWGEMDVRRVTDQINPIDERRGFTDIQFETVKIPIWLLRAEYWPEVSVGGWLTELGFQFIFNPNADFIPNQGLTTGNEAGGIWAIDVTFPVPSGIPRQYGDTWRLGAPVEFIDEPSSWDPEGFEYGLRISAQIKDTILNVMGFYGIENLPAVASPGFVPHPDLPPVLGFPKLTLDADGIYSVNQILVGDYPLQKFVGLAWTADLAFLSSSAMGGVSPVLRLEAMYEFDKKLNDALQSTLHETDLFRVGVGVDWKVKINALNPRAYFFIMPQFFWDRVIDYPSDFTLLLYPEKDYMFVDILLETTYYNAKWKPSLAYSYDITSEAHMIIPSITYRPNSTWSFILEGLYLDGAKRDQSYWIFRNKDYVAIKVKLNLG